MPAGSSSARMLSLTSPVAGSTESTYALIVSPTVNLSAISQSSSLQMSTLRTSTVAFPPLSVGTLSSRVAGKIAEMTPSTTSPSSLLVDSSRLAAFLYEKRSPNSEGPCGFMLLSSSRSVNLGRTSTVMVWPSILVFPARSPRSPVAMKPGRPLVVRTTAPNGLKNSTTTWKRGEVPSSPRILLSTSCMASSLKISVIDTTVNLQSKSLRSGESAIVLRTLTCTSSPILRPASSAKFTGTSDRNFSGMNAHVFAPTSTKHPFLWYAAMTPGTISPISGIFQLLKVAPSVSLVQSS
mmetsp:Transcript_83319/g.235875  ORF Transcript_83319/g.235875 Transcript_83319/m.235875 type:complete len:295 (+) Transcript_83319:264-1148(+)